MNLILFIVFLGIGKYVKTECFLDDIHAENEFSKFNI